MPPVDTSSFNASQLAAFNYAKSLGSGVQTTTPSTINSSPTSNISTPPAANTSNSFLNSYGTSNGFLNSVSPQTQPASTAPNMSTNSGPVYAAPTQSAPVQNQSLAPYTVAKGDTLSAIASKNNMSLAQLEQLNPQISNFNLIQPGQQVNLSATKTNTATPPPQTQSTNTGMIGNTANTNAATSTTGSQAGTTPSGVQTDANGNPIPGTGPQTQSNTQTGTTQAPATTASTGNLTQPFTSGLLNIGTQGSQAYNAAVSKLQADETQAASDTQQVKDAGTDLSLQTGQLSNLGNYWNSRIAADQSAVTNQASQEQTQAGALSSGGQLSTPSSQLTQVSPGNYLANSSGTPVAGGQAAGIQNATNWAIAQQNMAQGADYQGQSQNLSNAIQTMTPIGQKLTDFITSTGQNPATSPLINEQISKVNAQLYPQQVATLNAAVNDIRSYAIQILGSQSGANPTDVTNAVNSFDFTNFSATDLSNFLQDLNNLGNTRLSQLQSATNSSYGANATVGTPAEGITATDKGALNTGGMSPSSMTSNIGKTLVGTIASTASAAASAASGAASSAAGGVIGGAAEAYFAP